MLRALATVCLTLAACNADAGTEAVDTGTPDWPTRGVMPEASGCFGNWTTFYVDADGDGFGVAGEGAMHLCDEEAVQGFADNARDCDDENSNAQLELYADRDGDGFGASDAPACVRQHAPGYSASRGDCDDDDPAFSPDAREAFFDGIDHNCDGDDNTHGCIIADASQRTTFAGFDPVLLPPLDDVEIERDEACSDADLFFLVIGACPECVRFSGLAVIGNRGARAVRARVRTEDATLDLDVPAFGVSEAAMIDLGSPASPVEVVPLDGARDCDDTDNTVDLELGRVECYVP